MNISLIFAGGVGQRMNITSKPKQFLEHKGKPIIIYTLEEFQKNERVDSIVVVCVEQWIDHCQKLVEKFGIGKVAAIVPGGKSGQESIYLGLKKIEELYGVDDFVLVHDGVRPFVDQETIDRVVECVNIHGNAITVVPAIETITMVDESGQVESTIDRSKCQMARAPQAFKLSQILACHEKARNEGREFIDSATMMSCYGCKLFTVTGKPENIKITTPIDFAMFKAIIDARENPEE